MFAHAYAWPLCNGRFIDFAMLLAQGSWANSTIFSLLMTARFSSCSGVEFTTGPFRLFLLLVYDGF